MLRSLARLPLALLLGLALPGLGVPSASATAQEAIPAENPDAFRYVLPHPEIRAILETDKNWAELSYASPDGDHFLVTDVDELSRLELMARETHRLAELEIRPETNRHWHLDTWGIDDFRFYSLSQRRFVEVDLPSGAFASDFTWSPDGGRVAFLAHLPTHTEVWTADAATGRARSLSDAPVLATLATGSRGQGRQPSRMLQWTPHGTVITLLVPPDRGPEPEHRAVPLGPVVRQTREEPTRSPTWPNLLEDRHDEALFEYHTTAQLAELGADAPLYLGPPRMYEEISLSPDGRYVLATFLERPFSYITSYRGFPRETAVLDRSGRVVATVEELPLREGRDQLDDRDGPTGFAWRPDGAGLLFLDAVPTGEGDAAGTPAPEPADPGGDADASGAPAVAAATDTLGAVDPAGGADAVTDAGAVDAAGGAPGSPSGSPDGEAGDDEADELHGIWLLPPPFELDGAELLAVSEDPVADPVATLDGAHLLAEVRRDGERALAWWDVAGGGTDRRLLLPFHDPGEPLELPGELMTLRTANGLPYAPLSSDGTATFVSGPGYAEDFRPTPFVDRVTLADGRTERVFEGGKSSWDRPLVPLNEDMTRMIVSREGRRDFPDSFLWEGGSFGANLTNNADPFPQVTAVERIDFSFTRRDGVEVQGRVSMPVGWQPGDPEVPAIFWTYPREYEEPEEYGAAAVRSWNRNEFTHMSWLRWSDIWLAAGYALVHPDIPIIGENYNDTYIADLVDAMYGAIRAVDGLGVVDVDRLAHGGHSYGAFATANVLANAPYFKAGIAGNGAYNRTLTPDGFQSERRNLWEAQSTYLEMSPFFKADQIDTPLLLYHGGDDNNTGTFPVQSRRLISALTILGKDAVLYEYPYESHTPRAIENKMDLWARLIGWLDEHLGEDAGERATVSDGASS